MPVWYSIYNSSLKPEIQVSLSLRHSIPPIPPRQTEFRIRNESDDVVHVIVTDRVIKGLQRVEEATPPRGTRVAQIPPGEFKQFILYTNKKYLTVWTTNGENRIKVHALNLDVTGWRGFEISPRLLDHIVNFFDSTPRPDDKLLLYLP
jgi:hypothetical protein